MTIRRICSPGDALAFIHRPETAILSPMPRFPILIGASALALSALVQPWPARAADPAPLCIYEGNSFSEGAHICAESSLMMTCSMAGDRAIWKVVTDREISRLCATPSRGETSYRPRRHVARRSAAVSIPPSISPPAAGSAKCFTFNGKRFCE
jgi:hypothetical protein